MIEVTSLSHSTNYFVTISISAGTQGPQLSIPRQLVFRTKGSGKSLHSFVSGEGIEMILFLQILILHGCWWLMS